MLQAELKILGGKHQGKLIPLNTKKFLVGREQDCHLRPNSDLVSRHHCVFSIDDYAIRLRDLGSTNGTLVNGSPLRGEVILKSGDQVTIGKLELEVVIRQTAQKAPSVPVKPPSSSELPVSGLTPAEMNTQNENVDTSFEMPSFTPSTAPETVSMTPVDTAIIGSVPQYMQPPQAGYPPMMPPGYPMGGVYMPAQYPQYPPGYGQQPGYGQPMGYPMGYPQMMPMPQAYPGVAVASPPPAAPATPEAPAVDPLAVRLPKPEETGAKPATPPATAAGGGKVEMPSTSAADIIKQYMNRRS